MLASLALIWSRSFGSFQDKNGQRKLLRASNDKGTTPTGIKVNFMPALTKLAWFTNGLGSNTKKRRTKICRPFWCFIFSQQVSACTSLLCRTWSCTPAAAHQSVFLQISPFRGTKKLIRCSVRSLPSSL